MILTDIGFCISRAYRPWSADENILFLSKMPPAGQMPLQNKPNLELCPPERLASHPFLNIVVQR
jgi:hypothetical protein